MLLGIDTKQTSDDDFDEKILHRTTRRVHKAHSADAAVRSIEHSAKRPSMRGSRTFRVTAVAGDGRSPGRALTVRATVLAVLCSRAIAARVRALFQLFSGIQPPFGLRIGITHKRRRATAHPKGLAPLRASEESRNGAVAVNLMTAF